MRIAIVHERLITFAGSEQVLEQLLQLFPQAELFSLLEYLPAVDRSRIQHKSVHTSFLQRLPLAKQHYRRYLPLMPLAIEQLDLSGYDLVISSSNAVAKGVITGPDQLHICYCHSPIRYAWDLQHQYLQESGLDRGVAGALARLVLHWIRIWDAHTANGVDVFVANSQFIARRIWKCYRRPSTVIYPPVHVDQFTVGTEKEDYFLTVSRLVPYKRVDLIVEAFSQRPDLRLVVIGEGPERGRIQAKAGANIEFLGYQSQEVVRTYMQRARAFVFAAQEDFGIVSIEAQACGTPVIAYGRGGSTETVIPGETGLWFPDQTAASLLEALKVFETTPLPFSVTTLRQHAEQFAVPRFREQLLNLVDQSWREFSGTPLPHQAHPATPTPMGAVSKTTDQI
jgi:glycosyltransferase involved in cell wall biosynthesis